MTAGLLIMAAMMGALLLALPGFVSAGGACCAVSKADPGRQSLALVAASAVNHETVSGSAYELSQQAFLLKLGRPLGKGFTLQAQAGLPTATKLSHQGMELSGRGGLIYGAGLGYRLPRFLGSADFHVSAGYTRAAGSLDRDDGISVDREFRISELQGLLIGEAPLTPLASAYAGVRAYSGRNQLKDNRTGEKLNGEQEGNVAGLAGLRYALTERLSLAADAGFGHTKVFSLGAALSF